MPSDHCSIAARHRALTLSRAKSLRKHTRWLVQQQEKHQSQPDLSVSQADKLKLGQTLRRAILLKSRRASNARSTVNPFASTSMLVNPTYPFTPGIARSRAGSGFPWKDVQWSGNRGKIGASISVARGLMLTPYPPTTTRVVSTATAVCEGNLVAGKADAVSFLKQTRRKYSPATIRAMESEVKAMSTATIQTPRTELLRPMSGDGNATTDSDTTFNTSITSSSQVSDSDALMYLYAVTVAQAQRERPRANVERQLPVQVSARAMTYSYAERELWEIQAGAYAPSRNAREGREQRGERRPLLPPLSQRQLRDEAREKSPRRHQRDRHPQLIFPYAHESASYESPAYSNSQTVTIIHESDHNEERHPRTHRPNHHQIDSHITTNAHKHSHKHKLPSIKIRKLVDGYGCWVTLPATSTHHDFLSWDRNGHGDMEAWKVGIQEVV